MEILHNSSTTYLIFRWIVVMMEEVIKVARLINRKVSIKNNSAREHRVENNFPYTARKILSGTQQLEWWAQAGRSMFVATVILSIQELKSSCESLDAWRKIRCDPHLSPSPSSFPPEQLTDCALPSLPEQISPLPYLIELSRSMHSTVESQTSTPTLSCFTLRLKL